MQPATHSTAPEKTPWLLAGVPAGSEALVLSDIITGKRELEASKTLIHVTVNDRALDAIAAQLAFFAPNVETLTFPAWDCMPYDRASPHASVMATRMHTLATLAAPTPSHPRIIITTANAILQKLPPRTAMKKVMLSLRPGGMLQHDDLMEFLVLQGYRRSAKAMEPGEYAVRGGIIDIMPPGYDYGIRLDLFGDEIESLKRFEPFSQRTEDTIDELVLYPMSEVQLTKDNCERFRARYRELFGAITKEDPLYEAISESMPYDGMEHWMPLFYEQTNTLLDYTGTNTLLTMDQSVLAATKEQQESIRDYYNARTTVDKAGKKHSFNTDSVYHPLPPEKLYMMQDNWAQRIGAADQAILSPFTEVEGRAQVITVGYRPTIRFTQNQADNTPYDQLRAACDKAAEKSRRTLLACFSDGSRTRLQTILQERGFHTVIMKSWRNIRDVKGKTVGLTILPLEHGFVTDKAVIISEQDLLGERITRAKKKKRKSDVFMAESASFAEGELVVHKEHGIGRFAGLITVTVNGASHDCLKLVYDGDDKLFLPVENIELVSRFGAEEESVKLDKLGGVSWQARKAKLKQRIKIAAEALLKTAAQRHLQKGHILDTQASTYEDFCSGFPYVETEDQARAIEEVRADLLSGRPMDRLVCGDVGFGKTEVALRAAFIASSGDTPMQVAIIAPTTLLARQHYKNFCERFANFPIEVRQLSRMVTPKNQKETREKLAEGKVDIVIGTHALLAKSVQFKKLGLVIIDEEQHFGVGQKERLKDLKNNVHVLTLTATPIPRTLQMALTGVRDLSLITTPPVDRLAVRSFVMPFDPIVIKEAIQREMHRSGKCFIVTPRIKYMAELKQQVTELIPEAKIAFANGQMSAAELDEIMNDFYDGKYDILLSTAIIESGLDVPTANTMIIHNAHLFGLSQLYQMRGRVGRGKLRAYAYFMLPHHRKLTKDATRRLEVMQTLDTLGAGFSLASHDMDIRGCGNLVGEEQSGHVKEVGVELYQHMLEETIAKLKAGDHGIDDDANNPHDWSPQINLGISVLIPDSYVQDLSLRLGLYRRIAEMVDDEDINSFAAELTDRFGKMPEEVEHLIAILGIKLLCKKAGIERIDAGPKGAVISFRKDTFAQPDALLNFVDHNARYFKVRPDMKLVYSNFWEDEAAKLQKIRNMAHSISCLLDESN